ncbi:alpha/beta fold hydrolase [Halovenus salina]|uniref:alpha/beta fold hydrolase n=1 Tax=Halovenus salina TaxID=1510225 RepID=UPI002260C6F7|nr:alpha/beta hydrolase [Halovenus salina]
MKLRNVLAAAAGTVGGTALANRLLASRGEEVEGLLDGDQGSYRWRGFDIAYAELGDPEDDDVLLFHGINAATSNHEFAGVAEELAEQYHVIAPDLPGFGHSDRPPLLYSASLYTTFVADAIEELADQPLVVASGLTGSYVAEAAESADIDELVLACPTDSSMGSRQVWLRALVRSPVLGQGLFNLMVSKRGLSYFQSDHGYYDMDNYTEEVRDYEWQTAHQPGARFAPASFVSGFLDPDTDLADTLSAVDVPVTLVWGRNSDMLPLSRGRSLAEAADAGLVVFDRAKLLPHTEHPAQFAETVTDGKRAVQ